MTSSFVRKWGTIMLSLLLPAAARMEFPPFNVDTPDPPPTQCTTTKFTWRDSKPPYVLQIVFQGNNSVAQEFDGLTSGSLLWMANITSGTSLYLHVIDNSKYSAPNDSGPFTIQPGSDLCFSQTSSVVSSSGEHISHILREGVVEWDV